MGTLVVRTEALPEVPALVDHLRPDGLAWIGPAGGFVAHGVAARLDAGVGEDRLVRASAWFQELAAGAVVEDEVRLPGSGLVAAGSFTFAADSPGSALVVPAEALWVRGGRAWATTVSTDGREPAPLDLTDPAPPTAHRDRVRYAGSSLPDVHWLAAVATALERIAAGEIEKVVLARDHAVWSEEPFRPHGLARHLAAAFPTCFTFIVDGLVGATPELLVRRTGSLVESRVLAGTTGRGRDLAGDDALASALASSAKDGAEHRLAVASVESVLTDLTDGLSVPPAPSVLTLANVHHLATDLRGHAAGSETALDLAAALHPTAAVGGTPSAAAVALIAELERMDRGRYAGPVGWVDADGDGEWGVALRCAEVSGARARLFAGAGIVAGSLPEAELEETRLKLLAMRSAFEAG